MNGWSLEPLINADERRSICVDLRSSAARRLGFAIVPTLLAALAIAAPLLWHTHPLAAWAVGQFFSFVCHQDPARSFWIAGAPIAVCARCIGIYVGAAAGAWIRMSHPVALRIVVVAAAVNAIDVVTEIAGLHANWMMARFVLGFTLGAAIGALVVSAVPTPLRSSLFAGSR